MKSHLHKIPLIICTIFLLFYATNSFADIEQSRANAVAWLIKNQNGDGSWGKGDARIATTSEVLMTLYRAGLRDSFFYSNGLSWLINTKAESVDSLTRKIMALELNHFDTHEMGLISELSSKKNDLSDSFGFGAYDNYHVGFPDTGLALQAYILTELPQELLSPYDNTKMLEVIITAQKQGTEIGWIEGDYGWSYWAGYQSRSKKSMLIPTAYNILALQMASIFNNSHVHYYRSERGISWLINKKQMPNGRVVDNSDLTDNNVFSTALSFLAIEAVYFEALVLNQETDYMVNALDNAKNYIQSNQLSDGSWNNDALQTSLALRTLLPIQRTATAYDGTSNNIEQYFRTTIETMSDVDADGIPNSVEQVLQTNPNNPDSYTLIKSNGLDPQQLVISNFSVEPITLEILKDNVFSYQIAINGGRLPYQWTIESGSLPDGLALSSNGLGVIEGTPNLPGPFQNMIGVTDANGVHLSFPVSINVIDPNDIVTDTDGDGLWSSFELGIGSDPLNKNSTTGEGILDNDIDGLPDTWEITHNLDPNNASDAKLDFDNDGWTNIVEFQLGTDPNASNELNLGADLIVLDEDTDKTFNVTDNDQQGDLDTLAVLSTVSQGTLIHHGLGSFTYTPNTDYNGTDSFTYQLCDVLGLCSSSEVHITINAVNDEPIANAGTNQTVDADSIVTLSAESSSDIDGSISSYQWLQTQGIPVLLSNDDSATVSFTSPSSNIDHTLQFLLTVTDDEGASATDQIDIEVRAEGNTLALCEKSHLDINLLADGDFHGFPLGTNQSEQTLENFLAFSPWKLNDSSEIFIYKLQGLDCLDYYLSFTKRQSNSSGIEYDLTTTVMSGNTYEFSFKAQQDSSWYAQPSAQTLQVRLKIDDDSGIHYQDIGTITLPVIPDFNSGNLANANDFSTFKEQFTVESTGNINEVKLIIDGAMPNINLAIDETLLVEVSSETNPLDWLVPVLLINLL